MHLQYTILRISESYGVLVFGKDSCEQQQAAAAQA